MNRIKIYFHVCLMFFSLTGGIAYASVSAQGRVYMYSCGYYSNKTADIIVSYDEANLSNATEVTLHYGFNTSRNPSNYDSSRLGLNGDFSGAVNMFKDAASASYSGKVTQTIAARSSPLFLNVMEFFITVKNPDGTSSDDPSPSQKYFRVVFAEDHNLSCISGPDSFPPYFDMTIE